jgi:PPE family protein
VTTGSDVPRWRGHTHEELYQLLHDGPGAAASAAPSRRWAALATTLTEIGANLDAALNRAGQGWTGRAAGAAYDQLAGTATWADTAAEQAAAMRESVETQADNIARARAEMPAPENVPSPEPDPTVPAVAGLVGTATDLEPVEAAASAGEQRAYEVMAAYERDSTRTAGALAEFAAPGHLPAHAAHRGPTPGGGLTTVAAALLGLVPGLGLVPPDDQRTKKSSAKPKPRPHRPAPPPGTPTSAKPLDVPLLGGPRGKGGRAQTRRSGGTSARPATPAAPAASAVEPQPASPVAVNSTGGAQPASSSGAGTGPAAGAAPGAPHDKIALRRFGAEPIGSSQWFGDQPAPAVGERPRRRAELSATERVTEPVAILGREHRLAPTVIGDGKTR